MADIKRGEESTSAVNYWILGDRYGISQFQHDTMFALLKAYNTGGPTPDIAKLAF